MAHAQLLETADSDLGVYDVILSTSASGFVPVGKPFGEVVVSGSDGNPCVLETDVADFREAICSQIFSFDGVFTADMRIENFVDPTDGRASHSGVPRAHERIRSTHPRGFGRYPAGTAAHR